MSLPSEAPEYACDSDQAPKQRDCECGVCAQNREPKGKSASSVEGFTGRSGVVEVEMGMGLLPGVTAGLEDAPLMASIIRIFKEGMKTAIKSSAGSLAQGRRRGGHRQAGPRRQR
jgi:hypothetical protein